MERALHLVGCEDGIKIAGSICRSLNTDFGNSKRSEGERLLMHGFTVGRKLLDHNLPPLLAIASKPFHAGLDKDPGRFWMLISSDKRCRSAYLPPCCWR